VGTCLAVALLSGCNPDPTAGGFDFSFRNDTAKPVTVQYCGNSTCTKVAWTSKVVLAPGANFPARSLAEDFDEWYRFLDAGTKQVISCKTFHFKSKEPGLVVPISSGQACPGPR